MSHDLSRCPHLGLQIFGSASEETRDSVLADFQLQLGEGHFSHLDCTVLAELQSMEIPKTAMDYRTIEIANEITNELRCAVGVAPFEIPSRNVHIFPGNYYRHTFGSPEDNDSAGAYPETYAIVLNADKLGTDTAARTCAIFHEMIHLKGFHTFEVNEESSGFSRSGLEVQPCLKRRHEGRDYLYFLGLNEALVTEIEKRYWPRILIENEYLRPMYAALYSAEGLKYRGDTAKEEGVNMSEIAFCSESKHPTFHAYEKQRAVLSYLLTEIVEAKNSPYDEVWNLFLSAHFAGKLLPLARAVEETFGKGAFRMVGTMDTNNDVARHVLAELKKRRHSRL